MPGRASSSLAEAVLTLIRGDVDGTLWAVELLDTLVKDRERLAHAADERRRTINSNAELSRIRFLCVALNAAGECNLLEVLQNRNL